MNFLTLQNLLNLSLKLMIKLKHHYVQNLLVIFKINIVGCTSVASRLYFRFLLLSFILTLVTIVKTKSESTILLLPGTDRLWRLNNQP